MKKGNLSDRKWKKNDNKGGHQSTYKRCSVVAELCVYLRGILYDEAHLKRFNRALDSFKVSCDGTIVTSNIEA